MIADDALLINGPRLKVREVLLFGPFSLSIAERLLTRAGETVPIGGRALDILVLLASRAGEVVDKKDLMAWVWPDVIVEESNLRFHINALRKALGDGKEGARYLTTVPGRGYCFVASVTRAAPAGTGEPLARGTTAALPPLLKRMIGRDADVENLAQVVLRTRFATLVGPGGIGKTTIAIAVGHRLESELADGVRFVDLGSIDDPNLLPSMIASAVGFVAMTPDIVPSLVAFLHDKSVLIILDNCEHVIGAAAKLAEQLFNGTTNVHILATSREALRVEGEQARPILPLSIPPAESSDVSDVMSYTAVQLFVERVIASGIHFELTDADTPAVADICRRMDGIPLAIELAAGRVNVYGVGGIAALLGDRVTNLLEGRRTAIVRHQTIGAMLDWSYELISDTERMLLRRLSIFVGNFPIDAAIEIACFGEVSRSGGPGLIGNLVAKSLITADLSEARSTYRLLDSTRRYARAKLEESGEAGDLALRHARYYRDLLGDKFDNVRPRDSSGHALTHEHLGNIRAALDWSLGKDGDKDLGATLAGGMVSLLIELSLLSEARDWAERGIAAMNPSSAGTLSEIKLQAALGHALMFIEGNSDRARAAFMRAVDTARDLDLPLLEMRLLGSLHLFNERIGNYRGAVEYAERSRRVADKIGHPAARAAAGSFLGLSLHLAGNHDAAQELLESAVAADIKSRQGKAINFGFDYLNRARITHARHLWLVGKADQASRLARSAIEDATDLKQPVTLAIALIWGITVFLWNGAESETDEAISLFIAHSKKHSLAPYDAVGLGYSGELAVQRGDGEQGVIRLRQALSSLHAARYELVTTTFMLSLANGLLMTGRAVEALTTIDATIGLVDANGDLMYMPELLRMKGEILADAAFGETDKAAACFDASLEWARKQGALAWELRTSTSVARLWITCGRYADAQGLLAAIYAKFTEGFGTADLQAAKLLLDELAAGGIMAGLQGFRDAF